MPEYVAVACLAVPVGGRVIVVSDLFLGAKRTTASGAASLELAHALDRAEGPGALVVAGNAFDLVVPRDGSPAAALGAHEELRGALAAYLAADCSRRAILLPGSRDRAVLYDPDANAAVIAAGFEVAISAQLEVETAAGPRRVCIDPGWRFDERNAFENPADPHETPLGWLFGVPGKLQPFSSRLMEFGITLVVEAIVTVAVLAVVNHRIWHTAGRSLLGPPPGRANDGAREAARPILAAGGAGLVTGHTLKPELSRVGTGFYANAGASGEVIEERASRLGLPPVFVHLQQVSWVEIEPGADVHARLLLSRNYLRPETVLERFAAGRLPHSHAEPEVVASFPGGHVWPPVADSVRGLRRVRRLTALGIAILGLADLISAVVPPQVRGRLHPLLGYIPLGASEAAGALVALAGVGLLVLARGVLRGQRLAWLVSVLLLAGTVALHLIRHGEVVQSTAALVLIAVLWWTRASFRARFDMPSLRVGLATVATGVIGVTVIGATVLWSVVPTHRGRLPITWAEAWWATAGRLVGIRTVALDPRVDAFLYPALLAVGLGLAAFVLVLAFRPVVDRRHLGGYTDSSARAADIVRRRSMGTLDYFALRNDKKVFLERDGLVAYATYAGICLVSPDPICAPEERDELWTAFRSFVDDHGWSVAVLGAGEEWLGVYRRSGMRDRYIGDEGVVDVQTFSLEGGNRKGLRQAVNRIAKYGYTISFHDPAHLDHELEDKIREIMVKKRRGDVERGFSMTLGRIFDPRDQGLLLAVAHGPDGEPVAFCQFVPAPGIHGYSLDLMRRDDGGHPNGLLDFVLVRTIERLAIAGDEHLGLNFAAMRAVLAGEDGSGVQRWLIRRMSDTMQIESLWRFNAKFGPEWLPRYVVWDAAENTLRTALAIARAESFWELPIIGRFFQPPTTDDSSEALPSRLHDKPEPSLPGRNDPT
ncbi:MAG: phosphatidylglycerol lysyltransferase domain-containing protein [Acidimicrobiales bacterium]